MQKPFQPPPSTFVYISSGLLNCGLFCVHHGSPRPLNFPARHSTIIFAPRHVPPPLASPEIGARVCLQACIPPRGKNPDVLSRWNANRLPSRENINHGTMIDLFVAIFLRFFSRNRLLRVRQLDNRWSSWFFSSGMFFELFWIFLNNMLEQFFFFVKRFF